MPDSDAIRVSISADTSQLKAQMADASTTTQAAFERIAASAAAAGDTVLAQAAKFQAQGLTANEAASALQNFGVGEKEAATAAAAVAAQAGVAAPALETVSRAATQAGNSLSGVGMRSAMACTELAALSGEAFGAEYGLARVAAQSSALGPLIAAAFAPLAIIAFGKIVGEVATKLYHVYENVVHLKEAIADLDKASASEAAHAASLNEEYEEGYARRLEAQGKLTEASKEYQKAAADKPLELTKIDDKNFKQFSTEFVSFMQAVHTSADAPTVIGRINTEAQSAQAQLDAVNKKLANLIQNGGSNVEPNAVVERWNAQATDLQKKLDLLRGMVGEVQSQTGINAQNEAGALDQISVKAAEAAKKDVETEQERDWAIYQARVDLYKKLHDTVTSSDLLEGKAPSQNEKPPQIDFSEQYQKMGEAAQKAADALVEGLQEDQLAQAKYNADIAKGQEELTVSSIDSAQKRAEGTLSIQEAAIRASGAGELAKAQAIRDVQVRELEQEKEFAQERAAAKLSELNTQQQALGPRAQALGTGQANPESDQDKQMLLDWTNLETQKKALSEQTGETIDQINLKIKQSNEQAADASAVYWQKSFQQINNDFTSNLDQVLRGTERMKFAWIKMGGDMVISTVNALAQDLLKRAEHAILVNVLEKSMAIQKLATFLSGEGAKKAAQSAMNAAEITGEAGVGAAAAFASVMESLPFPANVATAPGVAAGVMGSIEAFAATGAAAMGAVVPQDMAIFAHAQEMILPRDLSEGMQNMIRNGGANGGSSSTSTTNNFNISAHDAQSMTDFITRNRNAFVKQFRSVVRNGVRVRR